jgi:hypothetical protein
MQNRVFFAQTGLDLWLADSAVELSGTELTLTSEARKYRLAEAAHVIREVTGAADANELVGRVKSTQYLEELGAEVMQGSMILGDNAYDIVPGFMATPIGGFDEFLASAERKERASGNTDKDPTNDEELLVRFVEAHSG